jgi:hypothetical protein
MLLQIEKKHKMNVVKQWLAEMIERKVLFLVRFALIGRARTLLSLTFNDTRSFSPQQA